MKRFYKSVGVTPSDGGWQVTLDGRGLKTVRGAAQLVPNEAFARRLAREWDSQGEKLDPASFPWRDMTDYAIDQVTKFAPDIAEKLVPFADTDTLLYRAHPDEALYTRQQEVWEPILTAFETREGVAFKRVCGIMHVSQSEETLAAMRQRVAALPAFALTALEAMTNLASSLTIGLSALESDADPDALWQAASLEEEWQAEEWGRDEEAEERRARRAADFGRAFEFARLANG